MKSTAIPKIFSDFQSAGDYVLDFLKQRIDFGIWMITRAEGDDWIILRTSGEGINPGTVLRWSDSICSEMIKDNGPHIAPDISAVAAYADKPIIRQFPIQAYIGVPLTLADGSTFGTLCAIDSRPQSSEIVNETPLIELMGAFLSTILTDELKLAEQKRQSERLQLEAYTDALTGLANRRAWNQFLLGEEDRCKRYGHSAAVFSIDLDDLKRVNDIDGHANGDILLQSTAQALRSATREVDMIARLGGDEFGIIAIECDQTGALLLRQRLLTSLAERGVRASVGMAMRNHLHGLTEAWELADQNMYSFKRSRSSATLVDAKAK
ncbi:sensor domain-containing diguanylate cyclase [Undibacterium oligocarboniphilum]|uniref:diguanylate cyclase n=1 Tax=Undibacterium oligocarboniphilum TaxID=666702 RepID=A0A850QI33_9BURK|nr:diguanylate cyclase [Undibacterium oligocarboniphilum]MBC3870957.1 diguanylate cyclase [Undibacterium oligocarboniphilum]NVO76420.1 diguanylate cyclase [Undibacterium oligocarboniphilum]